MMFLAFLLLAAWVIALALKVTVGVVHLLVVAAVLVFAFSFVKNRVGPGRRRTTLP